MKYMLILLMACARATATPDAALPISVAGKVEPALVGIKVVLQGDYTNVTQTDEQGGYAFEGVPAGRYTVRVSYGDFTREREVTAEVVGTPGDAITVTTLVFTPAGAIKGKATLSAQTTGNAGIAVSLDGTDIVTTTDDSGAYYLPRVPVGDYRVRVEKPGYGGRTRRGVVVKFAEVTEVDALSIAQGIAADFNHAPLFAMPQIQRVPHQRAPDSQLDVLPLDLGADEVARWDTVLLTATATDVDGDRLTYFWSVTGGTLDKTDADVVRWLVSDTTQTSATLTVRVVDERGAAAYLTSTLRLVDAQALSGTLLPSGQALYSYRPFAGTWRVVEYDFATGTAKRVAELQSLDDPEVDKVGVFYHATPFSGGDRKQLFWTSGQQPTARVVDGAGRGLSAGGKLVRQNPPGIVAYDPNSNTSAPLYSCVDGCGELEAASDTAVVSVKRGSGSAVSVYFYDFNLATRLDLAGPVGSRIRSSASAFVHTDVFPGGGRGFSNSIVREPRTGAASEIYSGAYDVFIGAFDGRFVAYTEQLYRAVYAPERAYVRDTQRNQSQPLDGSNEAWAQDETFAIRDGRLLARRYPRADWLQATDRTHYQLVIGQVPK